MSTSTFLLLSFAEERICKAQEYVSSKVQNGRFADLL